MQPTKPCFQGLSEVLLSLSGCHQKLLLQNLRRWGRAAEKVSLRMSRVFTSLAFLATMGIRVESAVTDHDLSFIGNVGGYSGDENCSLPWQNLLGDLIS